MSNDEKIEALKAVLVATQWWWGQVCEECELEPDETVVTIKRKPGEHAVATKSLGQHFADISAALEMVKS